MSKRTGRNSLPKNLTDDFLSGQMDEDRAEGKQRFSQRSKHHEQNKAVRTGHQRQEANAAVIDALPAGRVVQVFSRYCEVLGDADGSRRICQVRKTLNKLSDTHVVVGDRVRFLDQPSLDAHNRAEGIIERIEPRQTILTRTDSFKGRLNSPIVSNAEQMFIVASIVQPRVKWGLIDRMIIAARSGSLRPILCLNKIDLADEEEIADAREKLAHYESLGVKTIETSVTENRGLDEARELINGKVTVLAGHSGVGKSSLVNALEPGVDIRVGEISVVNDKGKHTTTSARIYPLGNGLTGEVIDTPGVKLFGLWNVTEETLDDFFPDVVAETAPKWRSDSYERIKRSLK